MQCGDEARHMEGDRMTQTPSTSIRLFEPAVSDAVVEERTYGPVTENDLDVVPADGISPPLVIDIPGILDRLDLVTPVALVQRDWQPALCVDRDLHRTGKVQTSYAISACL